MITFSNADFKALKEDLERLKIENNKMKDENDNLKVELSKVKKELEDNCKEIDILRGLNINLQMMQLKSNKKTVENKRKEDLHAASSREMTKKINYPTKRSFDGNEKNAFIVEDETLQLQDVSNYNDFSPEVKNTMDLTLTPKSLRTLKINPLKLSECIDMEASETDTTSTKNKNISSNFNHKTDSNCKSEKTEEKENSTDTEMPFLNKFVEKKNGDDEEIWSDLYKSSKPSLFVKGMLRNLYEGEELIRRSVSGKPGIKTPEGNHTRKQISPHKRKSLEKCFEYYLRRRAKLVGKSLRDEMKKLNTYVTEEISYDIKCYKKSKKQDEDKYKKC